MTNHFNGKSGNLQEVSKGGLNAIFCVAIGSSTGGLEALIELFSFWPATLSPFAVIIAQPLEEDQLQILSNQVKKNGTFSITRTKQSELLMPGIIYTTTIGKSIELSGKHLKLSPILNGLELNVADALFKSVAIYGEEKSVAIVLSGTGKDGATGIKHIKSAGGKVLVQMPQTAKYVGMPMAAIETDWVDEILPLNKIGMAVLEFYGQLPASFKNINAMAQKELCISEERYFCSFDARQIVYDNEQINQSLQLEAMRKEEILDKHQHTYVVINAEGIIQKTYGDALLFLHLEEDINTTENLWNVVQGALRNEVKIALAKAILTNETAHSNIKIIELKRRLFFIRIMVKPIYKKESSNALYLVIFENLESDKFETESIQLNKNNELSEGMRELVNRLLTLN